MMSDTPRFQPPQVAVLADPISQLAEAQVLASGLCLPLVYPGEENQASLLLVVTPERLELRCSDPQEGGAVYVDFVTGKNGFRRRHGGGVRQPLAKAVGMRGHLTLTILDATPGLGQDAYVLASLGGEVQMVERSPVMAVLLQDGLRRLAIHGQHPHMRLIQADARQVLEDLGKHDTSACGMIKQSEVIKQPEVIYLDPMYPHRSGSALVKKEMRRIRTLVGDDQDAAELLAAALLVAQKRVVVKRPRLAPSLAGPKPSITINSKNTRFDVYLVANRC